MKRLLVLTACFLVPVSFGTAFAGSNNADWGVGVILGEPTGISGKHWSGPATAWDFGLAWSTGENSNVALHADYLRHEFGLVEWDNGDVPLYYGIGVRYRGRDDADNNVGIRFPLGVDYLFADSAFDVFIEIVPIMDLVPDSNLRGSASIGARYFF